MHVPAFCCMRPEKVNIVRDIDIDAIARELSAQVEHWNSGGSGFVIERVRNFEMCITKVTPFTARPTSPPRNTLHRNYAQSV